MDVSTINMGNAHWACSTSKISNLLSLKYFSLTNTILLTQFQMTRLTFQWVKFPRPLSPIGSFHQWCFPHLAPTSTNHCQCYPQKKHLLTLRHHGPCKIWRRTWKSLRKCVGSLWPKARRTPCRSLTGGLGASPSRLLGMLTIFRFLNLGSS